MFNLKITDKLTSLQHDYCGIFCLPRVPDGELIGRIIADNDFTEGIAVSYLSQLLSAVDCLHQLNIAHLDIRVRH